MKYKLLILFIILLAINAPLGAQNHLEIKNVFDKYGKQEGSVFVQLSTDILSQGSKITLYKSLITSVDDEKLKFVIDAIESDCESGNKITELKKNGKLESGSYHLKQEKPSEENEYILYKHKSDKITVVYLKGKFTPSELESELKNLKNLIIYVNNKRIKLQ